MEKLKITVCGAAGRMGRKIVAFACADPALEIAGAVEAAGSEFCGRDAGELAGVGPLGVTVTAEMEPAFRAADAVVDFSAPAGAGSVSALAARLKKPLVVGTTGLDPQVVGSLERAAREIPVVYASNMSVGMNLLFRLVEEAARALGAEYDIEIVEAHHRFKKDAPSGTARTLCERAARGRGENPASVSVCGREGMTGERPVGQIGLHSVRAGDIVGDHTVYFSNLGERLELTHRAHSRDTFARGALRAAVFAAGASPGLYTMEDVIFGERKES